MKKLFMSLLLVTVIATSAYFATSCGKTDKLMGPDVSAMQNTTDTTAGIQKPGVSPTGAMPAMSFLMNYNWMSQMPPKAPGDNIEVAWEKTYNCGETCVLYERNHYFGTPLVTSEIDNENRFLGNPLPYGANTGETQVKRLLEHYGLHANIIYGTAASEVASWGAVGYSSIVGVRTHMSTTGRPHWMLFVGWDGTYMYFLDPGRSMEWGSNRTWSAGRLRVTPQQFYNSWSSFPSRPRTYLIVWR